MTALVLAWRSLVRSPGRGLLGVAGIAAVGALLFDMLLLSNGLVVSLRELLDEIGFDVRVMSVETLPMAAPPIDQASQAALAIGRLPEVDVVIPVRTGRGRAGRDDRSTRVAIVGTGPGARSAWTLLEGADLDEADAGDVPPAVVNRPLAIALGLRPGARVELRVSCGEPGRSVAPAVAFRVSGIARFPFEGEDQASAALRLSDFGRACGERARDEADLLLVSSSRRVDPELTAAAIERLRPDLHAFTNAALLARFRQVGFTYFRQISVVLASVTVLFGFLLITVLLTVSVNQRLAEIAALRALGLSRSRVALGVLIESVLLVAGGGVAALPIGLLLSTWLDRILRELPGLPVDLRFFVYQPQAVAWLGLLLAVTAVLAAVYPVIIVTRLPIAATLRAEVIS